jgi:flotillin
MKQVFDTMSDATGVDFTEILKANTYDAKVTKNVNVTGLEGNSEVAQAVGAAVVTQEVAPEDVATE